MAKLKEAEQEQQLQSKARKAHSDMVRRDLALKLRQVRAGFEPMTYFLCFLNSFPQLASNH